MTSQYINLDGDLEGKQEVEEQGLWTKIRRNHWPPFPSTYIETKSLLRSVYKELNRLEGVPLRTFEEAFKSKSFWTGQDVNCEIDTKMFFCGLFT